MNAGDRVMVVGLRGKDWANERRQWLGKVLWVDNDDGGLRRLGISGLPERVGAVVLTKFISHNSTEKMMAEARQRGVKVVGPLGNYSAKQVVQQMVEQIPVLKPKPETQGIQVPVSWKPFVGTATAPLPELCGAGSVGALRDPLLAEQRPMVKEVRVGKPKSKTREFVDKHLSMIGGDKQEADRLVKLARQLGMHEEVANEKALRLMVRRARLAAKGVKEQRVARIKPSDDPTVKLIDDAIAALELARDEVVKLRAAAGRKDKLREKLRKLVGA